jgi:hypothetical protein
MLVLLHTGISLTTEQIISNYKYLYKLYHTVINCILLKKFELTKLVACKISRHKLGRRRVKYLEEFELNVHKNLQA